MSSRSHHVLTADATGSVHAAVVNRPSVIVDQTQGEHLFYRITTVGGNPAWVFSCEHQSVIRKSTTEPGHPKAVYEWAMTGADFDSADEVCAVTMVFGPAIQYQVLVEHRDGAGNLIKVITNLTFAGGSTGDFAREEHRVFVL